MFKKCIINSCNTTKAGDGVTIHGLPEDAKLKEEWFLAILNETGQTVFREDDVICSKHFSEDSLIFKNGKRTLVPDAIPFENLEQPPAKKMKSIEKLIQCSVFSCENILSITQGTRPDLKYHAFPKSPQLAKKWKSFCNKLDNDFENSYICSDHFTSSDYTCGPKATKELKANACPSIYKRETSYGDEHDSPPAGTSVESSEDMNVDYSIGDDTIFKMSIEKKKKPFKRLTISFEEKIQILDRLKNGERISSVAKSKNMNEATIRTIKKNEEKIRKYVSIATSGRIRSVCSGVSIVKTEEALAKWIKECINKRIPVGGNTIRQKALKIYNHIERCRGNNTGETPRFNASKGWLENFKQRFSLRSIKVQAENASADTEAASKFTTDFKRFIDDSEYTADQIFNAAETGLCWKKLPSCTNIYKNHKYICEERVTLLLCSNASGDYCMKPMFINKSLNPRALKNCDNSQLPVYWRANRKACLTADVFQDWFYNCFVPDVESYMFNNNLNFKALLLLDNAPDQFEVLYHPNVKIMILPPNTSSLIQPLNQGFISTFKSSYVRMFFETILENTKCIKHNTPTKQAWKEFSILDCIKTVSSAISDLESSTLNACWESLLPDVVHEGNSVPLKDIEYKRISDIVHLLPDEEFNDITSQDIDELFLEKSLEEEDLMEFLLESNSEKLIKEEVQNYKNTSVVKPSLNDVEYGLSLAKKLETYFTKLDPCLERKTKFVRELNNCLSPYKKLLQEMKRPSCSIVRRLDEDLSSNKDSLSPIVKEEVLH